MVKQTDSFELESIHSEEIAAVIEMGDEELKQITGGCVSNHSGCVATGGNDPAFCRLN